MMWMFSSESDNFLLLLSTWSSCYPSSGVKVKRASDGRLTSGTRDGAFPASFLYSRETASAAIHQDLCLRQYPKGKGESDFDAENKFFVCSRLENLERRRNADKREVQSDLNSGRERCLTLASCSLFVRSPSSLAHINPQETREEQGKMNSEAGAEGVAWQGV